MYKRKKCFGFTDIPYVVILELLKYHEVLFVPNNYDKRTVGKRMLKEVYGHFKLDGSKKVFHFFKNIRIINYKNVKGIPSGTKNIELWNTIMKMGWEGYLEKDLPLRYYKFYKGHPLDLLKKLLPAEEFKKISTKTVVKLSKFDSITLLKSSGLDFVSKMYDDVSRIRLILDSNSQFDQLESITNPSKVKKLDIEGYKPQNDQTPFLFVKKVFTWFNKLEELSLINNRLTETPFERILYDTLRSDNPYPEVRKSMMEVKNLDLSNNLIENIEPFEILPNLVELKLKLNRIEIIEFVKGMFPNLQILDLRSNKIDTIMFTEGMFPSLQILDLSANKIEPIMFKEGMFPNLQILDLSVNQIETIMFKEGMFPNLEKLDLGVNQIETIMFKEGMFPNLQILDLSDNKIEDLQIKKGVFPKIKELILSNVEVYLSKIKLNDNANLILNFNTRVFFDSYINYKVSLRRCTISSSEYLQKLFDDKKILIPKVDKYGLSVLRWNGVKSIGQNFPTIHLIVEERTGNLSYDKMKWSLIIFDEVIKIIRFKDVIPAFIRAISLAKQHRLTKDFLKHIQSV